jgi:hypothetical protein
MDIKHITFDKFKAANVVFKRGAYCTTFLYMYPEGLSAPDIRMDGFRANLSLPFTKDELRFITEFKKTEKKFMEYLNKTDPFWAQFSNKLMERMLVDEKTHNIIKNFDTCRL